MINNIDFDEFEIDINSITENLDSFSISKKLLEEV